LKISDSAIHFYGGEINESSMKFPSTL